MRSSSRVLIVAVGIAIGVAGAAIWLWQHSGSTTGPVPNSVAATPATNASLDTIVIDPPKDPVLARAGLRASRVTNLLTLPAAPAGTTLLAAGSFEPHGTQAPDGIRITWPLGTPRPPHSPLWILHYDKEAKRWRDTGCTAVVSARGTDASGLVRHFSEIALADTAPQVAPDAGEFSQRVDGERLYATEHFTIRYKHLIGQLAEAKESPDQPAYIRDIAARLEWARAAYRRWGYRAPEMQYVDLLPVAYGLDAVKPDALKGTSGEVAGEASKLAGQLRVGCCQPNGKLIPISELQITLAHEFFHRVQMQYYRLTGPDKFIREGTAGAMELHLFPAEAPRIAAISETFVPVTFDTTPLPDQGDTAASFFFFLHQRNGPELLRRMWEAYDNYTDLSGLAALEAALKGNDPSDGLTSAFYDFAEQFLTTDPPVHPLYAILRKAHRPPAFFSTAVRDMSLDRTPTKTIPFDRLPPMTAQYVIVDRPSPATAKVRLRSAEGGASVRLFAVSPGQTTSLGALTRADSEPAERLPIGQGKRIGLLVSNTGHQKGSASVELTFDETGASEWTTALFINDAQRTPIQAGSVLKQLGLSIELLAKLSLKGHKPGQPFPPGVIPPSIRVTRTRLGMPNAPVISQYLPLEPDAKAEGFFPIRVGEQELLVETMDAGGRVWDSLKLKVVCGPSPIHDNTVELRQRIERESRSTTPSRDFIFSRQMEIAADLLQRGEEEQAWTVLDDAEKEFAELIAHENPPAQSLLLTVRHDLAMRRADLAIALKTSGEHIRLARGTTPQFGRSMYFDRMARDTMILSNNAVLAKEYWHKANEELKASNPPTPWPYWDNGQGQPTTAPTTAPTTKAPPATSGLGSDSDRLASIPQRGPAIPRETSHTVIE